MRTEMIKDKKIIAADQNIKEKNFWENIFSGTTPKSHFPYESRKGNAQRTLDRVTFRLEQELVSLLMARCSQSLHKLHIMLLTHLVLLLHRYSFHQHRDILVGTPIYRPDTEADFINTVLPLRVEVTTDFTCKEMLRRVSQTIIEASENQNYPIEILFERLNLPMSPQGSPWLDVVLVLTNIHNERHIESVCYNTGFFFSSVNGVIEGEVRYNTVLYECAAVQRIINHFIGLLEQTTADLDQKISLLRLPAGEETHQPEEGLKVPGVPGVSLHEWFEQQVARKPDTPAVVYGDHQLSYRQLNQRANRLARLLVSRGVKTGTLVAAAVEPCIEVIVGMVAIFKAGGVYLPVSPVGPTESNAKIVEENRVKLLLARKHLQETPNNLFQAFTPGNIIFLDDQTIYIGDAANLNLDIDPDAPACILYTSGTTGIPRGVLMEHRNITHLVSGLAAAIYKKYNQDCNLHVALVTLFMSGSSLKQIFGALLLGHTLHIYPQSSAPSGTDLCQFYTIYGIDISDGAPAYIRLLLEDADETISHLVVKHFLISGEAPPGEILKAFFNRFNDNAPLITNIYGSAEGGDFSTFYHLSGENMDTYDRIPIGKPFPGVRLLVLGKENLLQPVGVPGELYIGGPGVTRGYFNDPALTAEKFCLRRPGGTLFEKTAPPGPPGKNFLLYQSSHLPIYKTGDLARWLPDGNLELIGRDDELSEIEYHLHTHEDVTQCCVIKIKKEGETNRIFAYVVSQRGIDAPALQKYLSQRLPAVQIPDQFEKVDHLPLTSNFKIDRKQWLDRRPEPGKAIIAPRDKIEKQLLTLWAEVLETEENQISIDANFLELNGNSLRTIMLISKIFKQFDVRIPLAEVFNAPTIIGLARYIKEAAQSKFVPLQPVEVKEYYPLSSVQHRLYFVQQIELGSIAYNISQVRFLKYNLAKDRVNDIFKQLIKRHEVLRTSFQMVGNKPVQRVHTNVDFEVRYDNVNMEEDNPGSKTRIERMIKDFIRPFNLGRAPLFRIGLLREKEKRNILIVDMHHIITDAISINVLTRDFLMLYAGTELEPLPLQYRDYTKWQYTGERQENMKKQEKFWLKEFQGELPVLNLPLDFERPALQSFEGDKVEFSIGKENSTKLKTLAREEDLTLFILFLAIYIIFLSKITGQEDIIVGTGTAGRVHADLENIVGMFVSIIALRNYPRGEKAFIEFLREVKNRTLEAFENQEYPFEDLVMKIVPEADKSRNPLFDVGFTFLFWKTEVNESHQSNLEIANYESSTSKLDMTLRGGEVGSDIYFTFEYCTRLFKKSKIQRFADYFKEIVSTVANSTGVPLKDIRLTHGYSDLKINISKEIQGDFGF
ncbi:MAG: condensation domain-containing protein [Candidatus Aminicenantes bacterium]|jgi:fengycin family lipopeptide synthetase D